MKGFLSLLNLKFLPQSADFGLLLLRIGLGGSMLLLHGWKKATLILGTGGWAGKEAARKAAIAKFSDPLRISPEWSLYTSGFVEVVCSVLLIVGFCARFAAAAQVVVMSVAFFLVHQRALSGEGSGEMALVYLIGFAALLFAGPGKLSFDGSGGGAEH